MKYPPLHTSPEAIALRTAAMAWNTFDHAHGSEREGQRLHRVFLRAAIKYADAVRAAQR